MTIGLKLTNRSFLLACVFFSLALSLFILTTSRIQPSYKSHILSLRITTLDEANVPKSPGHYLQYEHPVPSNTSYCNFHYGLPLELKYGKEDEEYGPEMGSNSPYRILYNVITPKVNSNAPGITYATHLTATFMSYVPELLRYWDGMVSIAAFVPEVDAALVISQLNQFCYCLPGMSRVSFHFIYHKDVPPSRKYVYFTRPASCKVDDSSKFDNYNKNALEQSTYPINVCRNAARSAAITNDVLVSDIQLMPSEGLAKKFMAMKETYKLADFLDRVYVLPIFEVDSNEEIPRTKKELIRMAREEKAVYFHRFICTHCQKFPNIAAWMVTDPGDTVKPFITVKREVPYNRWEPIYIGTKNEPLYNELLSWEGLQDKMLQMLEMCLIGYKFVILDGAFLVHWPGMKKTKNKDEKWREEYVKANANEYHIILRNLTAKYPQRPQCKMQ
nr:unnamed protein product [Callosobruchus chinensis]